MKTIELTQGRVCKVDDNDFEWLSQWKWIAQWNPHTQSFYATRRSKKTIYIHRVIVGALPGEEVDHKNHDTLDCRRVNLRRCTISQNHANMRRPSHNHSGYKGVSWNKNANKWEAYITNGKKIHLGLFLGLEEAARMYDAKAVEMFGEFAYTNFGEVVR